MKLEQMSMKDLLALHNEIADKPSGPKTFSTRGKLVARIGQIAGAQAKLSSSNSCYWKQPPTLADHTQNCRNCGSWLLPLATQATWPCTITNRRMTPCIS